MLVVVLAVAGAASAQAQAVDAEARFVERIGQERQARGLGSLVVAADLQAVARRHAQRMADRGEPYHNPDLASEVQGWDLLGENVGRGWDADGLHQAFMDSPTHRDIIVSPRFTEVGVGVVRTSDGQMWVVEVFRQPASQPAPASPAAAPAPAPPPQPPAPPAAPAVPPAPAPAPTPVAATSASVTPPVSATTVAPPTPTDATVAGAELALATERARPAPMTASAVTGPLPTADVERLVREVPPAAWLAALLLSAVVGGQGLALRRLGLVA